MKPRGQSAMVRMSSMASGPVTTVVTIKNPGPTPMTIELRLVGARQSFRLGTRRPVRQLKPGEMLRVPIHLQTGGPGLFMAANVWHRAMLQAVVPGTERVLQALPIAAAGPAFARPGDRRCMHSPRSSSPSRRRVARGPSGDPPPVVLRTAYRQGTTCWANTGSVDTWWRIDNIEAEGDWVETAGLEPSWGDGIPDLGGWGPHYGYPEALDHCESEGSWTVDHTFMSMLNAGNADGSVSDGEWFYRRRRVGYHDAVVPDDPALTEVDVATACRWLDEFDEWLRADGLTDFLRYVEYWDTNVLNDPDAPDDLVFNGGDPAPDAAYLSAAVGHDGLADDLLAAMHDVLIYLRPGHLPRTFRPGLHFDPANAQLGVDSSGYTYSLDPRDPGTYGEWIAVCVDQADDMTLAHELFHYAAREQYGSEDRAFLLSYLFQADTEGFKPAPDWPDWG